MSAPVTITIQDLTSPGSFTFTQLFDTIWAAKYQAQEQYNRCPWVERGYAQGVLDVVPFGSAAAKQAEAAGEPVWNIELLDTSDQPGALGYHEDHAHTSKAGPSGKHSTRGVAAGAETPLAKVFVKTSREDNIPATEVLTHELLEMMVDPYVVDESQIRVYTNPANGEEYIGEVGDPAQSRAYDVGAPEKRPCGVVEAQVSDFAYPGWWGQPQSRKFTTAAEEFGLAARLEPFEVAPGGYMSIKKPGGEWEQIYGSAHAAGAPPVKDPDDPH